jgi:hypothetical protein
MSGASVGFPLWDWIVHWHGAENCILDLVDRPGFVHELMSRLTGANMRLVDQLEEQGLIEPNRSTVVCSATYTDELPGPHFDPTKPRARDTWTFAFAQIFSTVSPAMHEEFEIDYVKELCARFGLVYYGCCEPLHDKIDIIRKVPNVRKISISPWADVRLSAERMGGDFVMSRKPNPAFVAADNWDPALIKRDLESTIEICSDSGCPVELILKDISTVEYHPERLWEWERIAMDVVGGR